MKVSLVSVAGAVLFAVVLSASVPTGCRPTTAANSLGRVRALEQSAALQRGRGLFSKRMARLPEVHEPSLPRKIKPLQDSFQKGKCDEPKSECREPPPVYCKQGLCVQREKGTPEGASNTPTDQIIIK